MFNFIGKKEKKSRKVGAGGEELETVDKLEEVRRSLKIRSGKRKEKAKLPSGITADYSSAFFAQLDIDRGNELDRGSEEVFAGNSTTVIDLNNGDVYERRGQIVTGTNSTVSATFLSQHSDNGSDNSIQMFATSTNMQNLPAVPPRPPKRGILKGSKTSLVNVNDSDSRAVLMRNTLQNERMGDEIVFGQLSPNHNQQHLNIATTPSPSAESLTDTTNSSFATPPFSLSPVGESQGLYSWTRIQQFDDVSLPLPPIKFVSLPPPRELIITRRKTHDFGFSLRNAIVLDRSESLFIPTSKSVIFAEPGASTGNDTGLLPGDRLMKVNNQPVDKLPREAIIEMIRNSGNSVIVEVQPVAELVELSRRCMPKEGSNHDEIDKMSQVSDCNTLRRSASKRFNHPKSHENGFNGDIENQRGERVWLVHRGGFCAAIRLSHANGNIEPGKVLIELEHNGEQLYVDDDDVEKANPGELDLVEDICQLKHLNEASVLNCIRQRYASNLIHTRAGPTLIVVNPMVPLSLYSEKVVSMFKGCKAEDMPPHIYSLAQTAYRAMLETRRDQSLIFIGRSGSGKTASFKHALYYLTLAAGSANKLLTAEKVNAINTILEAFGNTKTVINTNATRFTQIFSLDFDHAGQIASASVQIMLMEKQRAGRRMNNESHYHVIARLLAGAEGHLQKELQLDNVNLDEPNLFVSISSKLEERQKASSDFVRLMQAFHTLNVDTNSVKAIWCVLAAIYHLGHASATKVGSGTTARVQFAHPSAARKAASLLGVQVEELLAAAFTTSVTNSNPGTPTRSPPDIADSTLNAAFDSIEGFVIGLYSEAVAAAVSLINKAISTSTHTIASILLVDSPGFQNPASCGLQAGATLSDLKHNYLQERLQLLFHHTTLVMPRERYAQEMVEIDVEGFNESFPGPLVSLIDRSPQSHVVRGSQRDLREADRRGLLWLLDEESIYPNSNDDSFLERLFTHYGDRESQNLLRKAAGTRQFILQHLQGTNPVLYSATGWLKASREHPAVRNAVSILQDSSKEEISSLFIGNLARGGTIFCGSIAGMEGTQSLRRVSSIRRSFTSAGVKRNSVMLQVKFTVDGLIDTLRRTGTHFVHCYLLQHNGGNASLSNGKLMQHTSEDIVNAPLLRSQVRGSQVLESARLHRLGFPETVPLNEFVRRFGLLNDSTTPKENNTVESILSYNEIDASTYRIGPSQVLFRSGVLNQLEAKRDELLSDRIIQLQSYCRGYLARRRVGHRRVQELAVRCIQRNVRAFMQVRDWPWWRLLVRVTPLLNVHRTEEQLKIANDELTILRVKLEKLDRERNLLKTENSKLESKLSEMTVELAEEHSTSNITSERLDGETAERLRLEKELDEQQSKYRNLQEASEKLEMELICAKSDLNGVLEDEDADNDEGGNNAYRLKYERVARELEFTKKRLQTQHEHDLEQLVGLKKQLEKKLADAYEEVEEQRQVVAQWKRKNQKMTNEMNDLRMLLDEQNSRNNLLEKRQRKFDSECQALQDTARQEKQSKERLSREKDVLIAEKFQLEQKLEDTRLELELKEEKVSALNRELEELTFGGNTEEEIAQLKRSKLEFEKRCKEQEEELDEMAGQIQLLEQAKLRLEMSLETMRKDAKREAQQRDDELEEIRGSSYKKVKSLECQLEQEHEERTLLLREKHELERRLNMFEDQDRHDRAAEEAATQKLKKDLRKCKALLRDAQTQIERAKADSAGKAIIRQLKNQLEDVESARTIAVKARQTAESELADLQSTFEENQRAKYEAEEKATSAQRDRAELQAQIDENEEEMAELMKKYSATVKQLSTEQSAINDYEIKISELESEKNSMKEQIAELTARLDNFESMGDPNSNLQNKRLELRTKELESKLEFEQLTRARLEVQCNRLKDNVERVQNEVAQVRVKEVQAQEAYKKAQKSLRELRDEFHVISNREQESMTRRKDIEKKLEASEAEAASARSDLRLALQRIADLQQAMDGEDTEASDSDDSDVSSDDSSEIDVRFRPSSTSSKMLLTNKHSEKSSLDSKSLNNHNANNFTNNNLNKNNISNTYEERDNTPRITITASTTHTKTEIIGKAMSATIENSTNGSDSFV